MYFIFIIICNIPRRFAGTAEKPSTRRRGSLLQLLPLPWRELRGSRGLGVVSNNWFDGVLLSILYMFQPSRRLMLTPPPLGPP